MRHLWITVSLYCAGILPNKWDLFSFPLLCYVDVCLYGGALCSKNVCSLNSVPILSVPTVYSSLNSLRPMITAVEIQQYPHCWSLKWRSHTGCKKSNVLSLLKTVVHITRPKDVLRERRMSWWWGITFVLVLRENVKKDCRKLQAFKQFCFCIIISFLPYSIYHLFGKHFLISF